MNHQHQFDDEWNKYNNFNANQLYADPSKFYRSNQKFFSILTNIVGYLSSVCHQNAYSVIRIKQQLI
jgi:hypothetical protein